MNNNQIRLLKAIIICCIFVCCYSADAVAIDKEKIILVKNDPVPVKQVIIHFLKWYEANLSKANNFPFLAKDSADNFIVDKSACNNYLDFLKTSKCISQKYIEYWKVYFDDKASELRDHPLQSGMPEGFDFDFVLITQEPELVLNQIDKVKFTTISMNNSVALIGLKWPGKNAAAYEFEMYKTKAGWQIGYISSPNFD
ncbi:MAG: hypothetical protein ABIT58_01310 [Ferruginibacter sp.]